MIKMAVTKWAVLIAVVFLTQLTGCRRDSRKTLTVKPDSSPACIGQACTKLTKEEVCLKRGTVYSAERDACIEKKDMTRELCFKAGGNWDANENKCSNLPGQSTESEVEIKVDAEIVKDTQ